ncbi:MAG TPA: amino acid permease [Candidatus Limnocylindrales bacterium]|nr:amino acid permease [Candidatus Limnocylindrales bacterium]
MNRQLFRTKSIDQLIYDADLPEHRLKKTLGWLSLTALGIGAIIGSGIFITTGTAAAGEVDRYPSILQAPLLSVLMHGSHALGINGRPGAGPGIAVSFLVVALICALAGLCYAELASMIPIAGSAYTYTYATLGEFIAWIIGWDLILEYAVSNMAVAVGFSAYVNNLLGTFHIHIPDSLGAPAYDPAVGWAWHFNLLGFLIVMFLTVLLVRGIRESARANNIMVGIKLLAIVIFCVVASKYIQPANLKPFFPNGFQGVLTGGAIVFFTYIGFDSVSTAAEECRNPKRDVPLGILVSLFVCAIFYVAVAIVLTGIQHWDKLNNAAPVANALEAIGLKVTDRWVTVGALMGMISSILVFQLGQARVWFAMSRDGLLPAIFSRVHKVFRTPDFATWVAGFFVAIPAGIFDIGTLVNLTNIGTLFAFILVSVAVLILRKRQPDRPRAFRVPFSPWIPIASVILCFVLMASLTVENWVRFFVWLIVGLLLYFDFGVRHSTAGRAADPAAQRGLMLLSDKALIALSATLLFLAIVGAGIVFDGVVYAGILERIGLILLAIAAFVFLLRGWKHYREDSPAAKVA